MEMSVLERQRAVLKWQLDLLQMPQFSQQQQTYFTDFNMLSLHNKQPLQNFGVGDTVLNENQFAARPITSDPGFEPGSGSGSGSDWPDYGLSDSTTTTAVDNYGISRTASFPPTSTKESFKKRKSDHNKLPPKAERDDENRAKKVKGSCEEEKLVLKNIKESENKEGSSKENSEAQKPDYIHVRARRGQATDSHSLAERVRREKISERMKYLQDLVPGCNKITGKAGMLDEIINYVQSLQRQVEFLSMKLAAVNPTLDFNIEDLFAKENQVFQACSSNFPGNRVSTEMPNLAYLQFSQGQQQLGPVCGSDLGMTEVEMGLRRTISAPVSIPDTFLDSSCLTGQQIQSYLPWDQSDAHTIYNNMEIQQATQQSFPSQTYTGGAN